MMDTPCSEVVWRVLATHSIRQFPLHFPSRSSQCAIRFQTHSKLNDKCHSYTNTVGPKSCLPQTNKTTLYCPIIVRIYYSHYFKCTLLNIQYIARPYLNTEEHQTLINVSFPCSTNRVPRSFSFGWGMNIFRMTANFFQYSKTVIYLFLNPQRIRKYLHKQTTYPLLFSDLP